MGAAAADDRATIERILSRIEPADQIWLSSRLDPPWRRRQRRLAVRDAAIWAARVHFPDPRITCAAKATAAALDAYALSNWSSERDMADLPEGVGARHRTLHAILLANDGKSLGWRKITDIFARKTDGACNGTGVYNRHDQAPQITRPD
jgi:hypothetical protein